MYPLQIGSGPHKTDHAKGDVVHAVFGNGLHRKLVVAPIQTKSKKSG